MAYFRDSGQPLADSCLRDIEIEWNIVFPDEYARFMRKINGGIPEPCGFRDSDGSIVEVYKLWSITCDNIDLSSRESINQYGLPRATESLNQYWLPRAYEMYLTRSLLPVGSDWEARWLCIGLTGKIRNHVVAIDPVNYTFLDDRTCEEDDVHVQLRCEMESELVGHSLAANFVDFIVGLMTSTSDPMERSIVRTPDNTERAQQWP